MERLLARIRRLPKDVNHVVEQWSLLLQDEDFRCSSGTGGLVLVTGLPEDYAGCFDGLTPDQIEIATTMSTGLNVGYGIIKCDDDTQARKTITQLDGSTVEGKQIRAGWLCQANPPEPGEKKEEELEEDGDGGFSFSVKRERGHYLLEYEVRSDGRFRAAARYTSRPCKGDEKTVFYETYVTRETVREFQRIILQGQEDMDFSEDNEAWPAPGYVAGRNQLKFSMGGKSTCLACEGGHGGTAFMRQRGMHRLAYFHYLLYDLGNFAKLIVEFHAGRPLIGEPAACRCEIDGWLGLL
ncbi:uncharacterized protein LOC9642110 [Selaginella moellendorffii]|nr:uncharacterized protein LOC9642110 [Selaginella moellendorffii]|eukprot:XP_024531606.1 uncharacterized protein LOC9642110 [Selaginella moellendorffii]